jgi:hypothetical protein
MLVRISWSMTGVHRYWPLGNLNAGTLPAFAALQSDHLDMPRALAASLVRICNGC